MTDIRIPTEAVDAVKGFIGSRNLRLSWWRPNDDSLWSVQGSERGIALVDGFLAGWLTQTGKGALKVAHPCPECGGRGFIVADDGQPIGDCFACEGQGMRETV